MNHHTLSHKKSDRMVAGAASRVLLRVSLFLMLSFIWIAGSPADAQVAVRLKMNKSSYLVNEPVTATVFITNHAGRELVLRGSGTRSWLSFNLSAAGRPVPVTRRMKYKSVVIPVGQTVSRTVSVSSTYSLGRMGNYTCAAIVNMPGATRNGFSSNRVHFTVAGGRNVWVQRAGVPGAPGEIREYKLISFSGNQAAELYAQVNSANIGSSIRTIPLGKILSFRRPTATLDGQNNMHALYQVKPNLFTHTSISPKGDVIVQEQFKKGKSGIPRLMAFGNGEVRVAGGVLFDAYEEAEKKKQIRGVTERPAGVYR